VSALRTDRDARAAAWHALTLDETPSKIAAALAVARTAASQAIVGDGITGRVRGAYVRILGVLESLYRWDADVRDATADAERHLAAARRNAAELLAELDPDEPAFGPLRDVLTAVGAADDPSGIEAVRERMRSLALPQQLIRMRERHGGRVATKPEPPQPRAVVLFELGGRPVTGPMLVHPHRAYELQVEARVLDWPEWADKLAIRFLSRWQGTAADVPDLVLERPASAEEGLWRARATSGVVVRATPAEQDKPLQFVAQAEMSAAGRSHTVELLGYAELALHAYDPALDFITGSEVIDQRVYEVLVEVGASGAPEPERNAFADLFKALADEAQALVANNTFRAGTPVLEAAFQARLLERLQSVLGATNVRTGSEVGGGEMDVVYLDTMTAELKVERATPASLDHAAKYLGQPTQYAAAAGRQLAILCILDVSKRSAPPGLLANGIGILRPRLAGSDQPAFPTLVGVVIVSGGLPLPSEWSGTRVEVE
jgi:hypothetical protein